MRTPGYAIYSTVDSPDFNQRLAQVMEGAATQYRTLAPSARIDPKPLECYVFADRRQWADFTRQRTGDDAGIYLQINRGGYTVRDFFVAYWIGDNGTYAVAAHEGWHQFVARHCKNRLPPFLEEGIATTFETIEFTPDGLPRWNTRQSPMRAERLKKAIEEGKLWPLSQLVGMHAGDVVGQPADRIEAFYAQNWGFARFMLDADGGRHRPALLQMMADSVAGTLFDPTGRPRTIESTFNPTAVAPLLEHYLGMPMGDIESAYLRHLQKIAREEVSRQNAVD